MDSDEVNLSKLCDAIVGYLKHHPDAADTAHGIGNWWLPEQRCDADARLIGRALDRLVEEGRVTRHALVDGTVLYTREASGSATPGE
ncbi:hypothetical protein [Paraburkholderia sp. BCC1886]|uniref:hypothetical protein n=1 Tax=Paraburkholderia sp. BCC1886 TaxID=2562670 RepID=UPI00118400FD|nr:hypothetical protein [Paraburkholderia sp. BCC1886]